MAYFIFALKKKKYVNLTVDIGQAIAGPRRNRWPVLRASSSRPHVPTPPNLISEALFPVAQMAPRTPKRSTSEGLRALGHIWHPVGWWQRLRGGGQGGKGPGKR